MYDFIFRVLKKPEFEKEIFKSASQLTDMIDKVMLDLEIDSIINEITLKIGGIEEFKKKHVRPIKDGEITLDDIPTSTKDLFAATHGQAIKDINKARKKIEKVVERVLRKHFRISREIAVPFPIARLDATTVRDLLPMLMNKGIFSNYNKLPTQEHILERD